MGKKKKEVRSGDIIFGGEDSFLEIQTSGSPAIYFFQLGTVIFFKFKHVVQTSIHVFFLPFFSLCDDRQQMRKKLLNSKTSIVAHF